MLSILVIEANAICLVLLLLRKLQPNNRWTKAACDKDLNAACLRPQDREMIVEVESKTNQADIQDDRVPLSPEDRQRCIIFADLIILQCLLVSVGAFSILNCLWSPDKATLDYDKLVRTMYLFDFHACGYKLKISNDFPNLKFSNYTGGYDVVPIKWMPAVTTVSTRLTSKTRMYIELSLAFHCLWLLIAAGVHTILKRSSAVRTLNTALGVLLYSVIFMVLFDVSMALVYVSHIKQSLTKGMVLRYSGWGNTLKLQSYEEFAGWLPIAASCCWLRGGILLLLNLYGCKVVMSTRRNIQTRQIKMKYENERYTVLPEAKPIYAEDKTLIYRSGEHRASQF